MDERNCVPRSIPASLNAEIKRVLARGFFTRAEGTPRNCKVLVPCSTDIDGSSDADIDGDGTTSASDLSLLLTSWSQ